MPLSISPTALISRTIRANASNGIFGVAILTPTQAEPIARRITSLTRMANAAPQNFFDWVFSLAGKFVGFIGGVVKWIGFSATKLWQWVVNGVNALKAFNWNATDQELKALITSRNNALASLWGGVLGAGFGWLSGIVIGYGIGFICPVIGGGALARLIATETGREAIEEVRPQLVNALTQTLSTIGSNALIGVYINFRRFLKNAPVGLLTAIYGSDTADFIRNTWGAKGGPNMSFNTLMDEAVESIGNQALQNFVEEFFDEAWDSFTEAGFIVAQQIDDSYAQARAAQREILGPVRTVEIVPDTEATSEKFPLVELPQALALTTIQSTINSHRLMHNRDVGQIVGQSYEQWLRARPQLRSLSIVFRSRPQPPWIELTGKRSKYVSYSIPDAKPSLSWAQIKNAASPYTWGKFCARAKMSNGRQMAIYGATAQEAKNKLLQLASLSDAEIQAINVSEEDVRPQRLRKESVQLYPAYATMLARRNSADAEGRVMLDGRTFDEEVIRFPLWVEAEPSNLPPLN